jgi:hypothetical protein
VGVGIESPRGQFDFQTLRARFAEDACDQRSGYASPAMSRGNGELFEFECASSHDDSVFRALAQRNDRVSNRYVAETRDEGSAMRAFELRPERVGQGDGLEIPEVRRQRCDMHVENHAAEIHENVDVSGFCVADRDVHRAFIADQ